MIYLIRHGEAAAGWGDHPDPGLSEAGKKQATAAAVRLVELGASSIVTSPMARCRETASALELSASLTARVEARVSEVETPEGVPDRVAWLKGIMAGNWQDGGSELLAWRAKTLEAIREMPSGAAVFTHFVAINAIVSALDDDDRAVVFRPGHCSITILEGEGSELRVSELGGEGITRVL